MGVMRHFTLLKRVPSSMKVEFYVDEEGNFNLDCPKLKCWVACTGTWHGTFAISLKLFRDLAKVMPNGDPLTIGYDGNKMNIGSFQITGSRVG